MSKRNQNKKLFHCSLLVHKVNCEYTPKQQPCTCEELYLLTDLAFASVGVSQSGDPWSNFHHGRLSVQQKRLPVTLLGHPASQQM